MPVMAPHSSTYSISLEIVCVCVLMVPSSSSEVKRKIGKLRQMIHLENTIYKMSGLSLAKVHPTESQFALLHSGNIIATLQNVPSFFFPPSCLFFFFLRVFLFLLFFAAGNKQKVPSISGFSLPLQKIYPQGPAPVPLPPGYTSSTSCTVKLD